MDKADMRKGMLLKGKVGAEEKIYRVLDLKEKVLVLDCVKKIMPVWKTYEELSDYVEKEEESMAEVIDIIDAMEGECRKTVYQRYNMISGILTFLSEENMRTEAIKRASERYGISKSGESCKYYNSAIGKNIVGKTLTETIDELRHDNDIRDGMCDFDKLIDIVGNYKDKEGNPVVIESKF